MSIILPKPSRVVSTVIGASLFGHIKSGRVRALPFPLRPFEALRREDAIWVREGFRVSPKQHQRGRLWVSYGVGEPALSVEWQEGLARPAQGFCQAERMPVACSRMTLIVEAVAVKRLSQVTEDEAIACGVGIDPDGGFSPLAFPFPIGCDTANEAAVMNYESMHGRGREKNQEVAYVTFRSLMRNIRTICPEVRS